MPAGHVAHHFRRRLIVDAFVGDTLSCRLRRALDDDALYALVDGAARVVLVHFLDFRGRTVSGSYSTSREGLVSVKTLRGNKTTTLGGSNPRLVARILLRELAVEGKA
jgi:hypothetical protein